MVSEAYEKELSDTSVKTSKENSGKVIIIGVLTAVFFLIGYIMFEEGGLGRTSPYEGIWQCEESSDEMLILYLENNGEAILSLIQYDEDGKIEEEISFCGYWNESEDGESADINMIGMNEYDSIPFELSLGKPGEIMSSTYELNENTGAISWEKKNYDMDSRLEGFWTGECIKNYETTIVLTHNGKALLTFVSEDGSDSDLAEKGIWIMKDEETAYVFGQDYIYTIKYDSKDRTEVHLFTDDEFGPFYWEPCIEKSGVTYDEEDLLGTWEGSCFSDSEEYIEFFSGGNVYMTIQGEDETVQLQGYYEIKGSQIYIVFYRPDWSIYVYSFEGTIGDDIMQLTMKSDGEEYGPQTWKKIKY